MSEIDHNDLLLTQPIQTQGIFTDPAGQQVKFFIQKDLPEDLQAQLREVIQREGGVVDTKVPIKGWILIQHDSPEGERLVNCWQKDDRPERFFVPYTWVNGSIEQGKMIPQIFIKDEFPLKMLVHPSIANLNSRDTIEKRILHAGGVLAEDEEDAEVILVDPETEVYHDVVRRYCNDDMKLIESYQWIKKCIDRGLFYMSGQTYRNPGGRRPGEERTAFTEDDEANLCTWIAAVIPYKESGGRTGNKIYQELLSRSDDPGYEWVSRHTWQSWRERYKKNATRLDQHIAALVNLGQSGPVGKAQFGYFRISDGKPKAIRKRRRKTENGEDVEPAPPSQLSTPATTQQQGVEANPHAPPVTPEGADWTIREGQLPPPIWGKRDTAPVENPLKRHKTVDGFIHHSYVPAPVQPSPQQQAEQAITDIANECRFLVDEVREYYDRSRDLDATRARFAKLRMMINSTP